MRNDAVKTALIVLWVVAVVLGAITFIIVFYPTGSYQPSYQPTISKSPLPPPAGATASSTSASAPQATSTTPTSATPTAPTTFASEYIFPYPVAWTEGYATLSITHASLKGNRLAFKLTVQTGNKYECVHMNLRLVTDELGNMKAPDTRQFTFPDQGGCGGTPNVSYKDQVVVFTIDPGISSPFLFTTGGASDVFFQVATTSAGGIEITLPPQSG